MRPSGKWDAFSKIQAANKNPEGQDEQSLLSKIALEPLPRAPSASIPGHLVDSPRYVETPHSQGLELDDFTGPEQNEGEDGSTQAKWIIMPEGSFRTAWMHIQLAVAMYIIWVTPVRVGFNIPSEGLWFWFEGMIDLFFYADLTLNFFTAYEDPVTGDIITNHKLIAQKYLKGWFAIDLLATFPSDYIVRAVEGTYMCSLRGDCSWTVINDSHVSLVGVLRLLRFFRIIWILKHVKSMRFSVVLGSFADDLYTILPALSIFELVIVLLYLGHISGCFFYLLSTPAWQSKHEQALIASGEMTTWMQHAFAGDKVIMMPLPFNHMVNSSVSLPPTAAQDHATGKWWVCPEWGYDMVACLSCRGPKMRCSSHYKLPIRYVTSMYWAYTTMTTVGYGDISSTTFAEKVWAIITMIVSGFFFSFCVGRMASLVGKLDSHRTAYNEKLEVVTTFLKDTNLPRHLSKRVLDMFKKQKIKPYDRQQVLSILPFELKAKILRHLYAGAIHNVPLLNKMADDDLFVSDMCLRLQPYNCPASTFVYQRGETGGDVFILMRGELHLLDLDRETFLYKIPEGSVFGEGTVLRHLEGFLKAKRTDNVWCKTPCYMLRIAQEDMGDLLEHYPQLLDTLRALHTDRGKQRRRSQPRKTGDKASVTASRPGSSDSISALHAGSAAADSPVPGSLTNNSLSIMGKASVNGSLGGWEPMQQQLHKLQQQPIKEQPLLRLDIAQPGLEQALALSFAARSVHAAAGSTGDQQGQAGDDAVVSAGREATGPGQLRTVPAALDSLQVQQQQQPNGNVTVEQLQQQIQRLSRQLSEQHSALMDEMQFQRYMIHQVPGRIMNHLVMVLGSPTEDQRRMLAATTEQWNKQQRWNL